MTYRESYNTLHRQYDAHAKEIQLPGNYIEIHYCVFSSENWKMLPGAQMYRCAEHGLVFHEDLESRIQDRMQPFPETLKHGDIDITENKEFTYALFKKAGTSPSDEVIFLFHGLNERSWYKYLPRAETLVARTNKTVILFPIAFHINRSPADWWISRPMNVVSGIRRGHSPSIMNSTFANAAISARIEMIPQRFFWSGLQTFDDVVCFVTEVKNGKHPLIASTARFN